MSETRDSQSKNYRKYQIDIHDYQILHQIESGGFGLVYSVQNKKTKYNCAAKVLSTHGDESQYKKMINREIGIMIRCQHPTIIKFIGYSFVDFQNQKNVTIFMDLAKKGSLAELLNKSQNGLLEDIIDNTMKQIILVGIARGMMILHQHHVIHRDLKPGNILLDNEYHPHITDFGLSKLYETGRSMIQSQQCGTSMYMAPEIIEGIRYNGKVDVYSFGILMYEVVTNSFPYPLLLNGKMSQFSFNKKVVEEDYRPKFEFPINQSIHKLIESCWAKDPKERPTFEEIFKKLAYNIDDFVDNIYEDNDDIDTDSNDNNYYLDGVDVNEVIAYANDIDNNLSVSFKIKEEENEKKSIEDIVGKIINPIIKENEEIKKKIEIIQNEKEQLLKQLNNAIQTNNYIMKENEEMKNQITLIAKEKNELKNENDKIKNQIISIQNDIVIINQKTNNIVKENMVIKNQMNSIQNEKQEFIKKLDDSIHQTADIKTEIKNRMNDIQNSKEILQKSFDDSDNKKKHHKILNNEIDLNLDDNSDSSLNKSKNEKEDKKQRSNSKSCIFSKNKSKSNEKIDEQSTKEKNKKTKKSDEKSSHEKNKKADELDIPKLDENDITINDFNNLPLQTQKI